MTNEPNDKALQAALHRVANGYYMDGSKCLQLMLEDGPILAAAVRALQADKDRLDWLDAEAISPPGSYPVMVLSVKYGYKRDGYEWVNIVGTAREAIDAARAQTTKGETP